MLLATSFAAPDERKVPPRTPPQRLNTLLRFSQEYITGMIEQYRPNRAPNQDRAAQRIHDRLLDAYMETNQFGLRKCSYFDDTVPNGGPRPDNTGKRAVKDLWVQKELCALGEYSKCLRKRRSNDAQEDEFDPFDDYESQLEHGERATAVVRLSDQPGLALRQVTINCPKLLVHSRTGQFGAKD